LISSFRGFILKDLIKKLPFIRDWVKKLNNLNERSDWVERQLKILPEKSSLLDAGCGDQRYRRYCSHLLYKGQDFGKYRIDEKK